MIEERASREINMVCLAQPNTERSNAKRAQHRKVQKGQDPRRMGTIRHIERFGQDNIRDNSKAKKEATKKSTKQELVVFGRRAA
jgi:hypothetical protein